MRSYEKVILVPIIACLAALALILAATLYTPTGDEPASARQPDRHPGAEPARDANAPGTDAGETKAKEADAVANGASEASRQTQDPDSAAPASFLLCSPEASLSRVVDPRTRHAVAADEAGHVAFYGGAAGETGTLTNDSYEILAGCLPQLAFTNLATVLVEGRGPEAAGPANLRSETRRTADDVLLTSFSFAGGVRLDQRLSLEDGSVRADYTLSNESGARTSVSLRALVTPVADLGPSRDGRVARFIVEPSGGGSPRPVETATEIDGAQVDAVEVPRTGAASDSSGRLLFAGAGEGRRPDVLAFASTLDITVSEFRCAPEGRYPAQRSSAWPLPPMSTTVVYWLYEGLPAGGSSTFSYRYEPAPPERDNGQGG